MRLYLLPLSTRRTLLYAKHVRLAATSDKPSLLDRVATRAARIWSGWEARESGWQHWVVKSGNTLLRKIPYEEWALKSVPPLSARSRNGAYHEAREGGDAMGDGRGADGDESRKKERKVEVVFPGSVLAPDRVRGVLSKLATEREGFHRRHTMWCIVGLPITAPFALIPIIPNLPFFYLLYRAWSHWRALVGGRHLKYLVEHDLLEPAPSRALDAVYGPPPPPPPHAELDGKDERPEEILLSHEQGRRAAAALDLPELEAEIERAVWQVENKVKKEEVGSEGDPLKERDEHAEKRSKDGRTDKKDENMHKKEQ